MLYRFRGVNFALSGKLNSNWVGTYLEYFTSYLVLGTV
jgi:hypothetical protein